MPVRAEQNHRLNWPNIIDMKEYLDTIKALLKENKTTGGNHSEAMLHYSKMNLSRMKRWMKAGVMNPELEEAVKAISEPQTWVVLTEAWCGDSAQNVPWLEHFLNAFNPKIETFYFFRDEHPDLMNQFLTNGSRSIPKAVFLSS